MYFIKKYITLSLLLLISLNQIVAQNNYFENFKQIENEITLLTNLNNLIPIQRLDYYDILIVNFSNNTFNTFEEYCNKYTNCDFVNISNIKKSDNFKYFKNYNLLILITDTLSNIEEYKLIENIKSEKIFCSFSENNSLINNNFEKDFNSIVIGFGNSEIHQQLAAQLIFGGICVSNKLDFDLNNYFKKGSGISTISPIRFKYTTPYELDLDSVSITQKIDSIVNNGIKNYAFPGCQVLMAKDEKIFFNKSYGYQTYDSIIPINNSTIYDLASVTKISAPLPCLMKLYDQNKFYINAKFSQYWKPFKHSNKSEITVIDALTHQAQLTAWIPFWKNLKDEKGEYKRKTIKQDSSRNYNIKITENKYLYKKYYKNIYEHIKESPLLEEKKYVYSDLSFYLYPPIIEEITKQEYENYLYSNFYDILGCNSMKYNPLKYFDINDIAPTELDTFFRNDLIHGNVHDEGASLLNGVSGHAGMFANANDLAKLMQMYLNYGNYGGYRYISDSTLKKFTACQFCESGNRRGIGFDKPSIEDKKYDTPSPDASELSFGHTGFTGTFVWADPKNGLLIVFLSNRVYPTRDNKKLSQLNIRTSIHQVIYDALKK